MSFDIGQQVVCISDRIHLSPNVYWRKKVKTFPRLNGIYTVREIRVVDEDVGICLEEIVNPPAHFIRRTGDIFIEPAFYAHYFRPLKKTSIEVFRKLLTPADLVDA